MRVRFTESVKTREAIPQSFEAGQEYDLLPASAHRWMRRNVAVAVETPRGNSDAPRAGAGKKKRKKKTSSS